MRLLHRLNPLLSRARPRLGLSNDYKLVCERSWEVSPGHESRAPSAIFMPGELEKIKAIQLPGRTVATEVARAQGCAATHAATRAYELRDAVLARGHLFTSRAYVAISGQRAPVVSRGTPREFKHAVLASSGNSIKFFGHWLLDDIPKLLAARELGDPVSVLTDPSPAQRDYLELLDQPVLAIDDAYFERIVVLDDFAQNRYKRARYEQLRTKARARFPSSRAGRVMLLRGDSGVRRVLVNEHEVTEVLRKRGFRILDPLRANAAELLEACIDAEIVVGVEGSQLANGILWIAEGGTLVTLQPPNRFDLILKGHCDCLGVRYAFVVGEATNATDFSIDTSTLERLLDRLAPAVRL